MSHNIKAYLITWFIGELLTVLILENALMTNSQNNPVVLSQAQPRDNHTFIERSIQEQVLLAFCVTGFLGIFPFAVYRFINTQWLLGIIDTSLLIIVLFIGLYVWIKRELRLPSITLTLLYMSGMIAVIHVNGPALIYWAFPTMAAAYFLIRPREAAAVNILAMVSLMPVLVKLNGVEGFTILITLILNNMFAYIFSKHMRLHNNKLVKEATKDFLTGTDNRKLFDEKFKESLAWYKRKGVVSALIIMDVDHFKNINDQFGHAKGDEVLKKLVSIIKKRTRITDHIFRLGGEEFAILLPETNVVFASFMAEELRQQIEKSDIIDNNPVTVSFGVSECKQKDTEIDWFTRADNALYSAKNTGRNKVVADDI